MKPIPHLLGTIACLVILYLAYTEGGYHSPKSFYAASTASTYILYSSLALSITCIGKTRKAKAWTFFIGGLATIFTYIPAIRYVVDLFYVEERYNREFTLSVMKELYFWSPVIVGSLCIFRAISIWSDESLKKAEPNQALQPNAGEASFADEALPPRG
jgi:hypothetical protein